MRDEMITDPMHADDAPTKFIESPQSEERAPHSRALQYFLLVKLIEFVRHAQLVKVLEAFVCFLHVRLRNNDELGELEVAVEGRDSLASLLAL